MAVVTIARHLGSGGDEVARAVARELDAPYYDKEIIAAAARQLGFALAMAEGELADRPLAHRLIGLLLLHTPPDEPGAADGLTSALAVTGIPGAGCRRVIEEDGA